MLNVKLAGQNFNVYSRAELEGANVSLDQYTQINFGTPTFFVLNYSGSEVWRAVFETLGYRWGDIDFAIPQEYENQRQKIAKATGATVRPIVWSYKNKTVFGEALSLLSVASDFNKILLKEVEKRVNKDFANIER